MTREITRDFKYKKNKKISSYLNMQILYRLPPPQIGAELSSKLKYPYLKDHYRFCFLPIFLEMVAR